MTVHELIVELLRYPGSCKVVVTWKSTVHELDYDGVYQAPSGTVLIDGDGSSYKERFVSGGYQV